MDRKLDELLSFLMQNMTIVVSGEKIARDLGVSHATLIRWIDKLRRSGVEIRGKLFTGYCLVRLPDVLLPQIIRPRLRTKVFGRTIHHLYRVDSTNAFAFRLSSEPTGAALHGTLVVAEEQTAGRGRMGRRWYSEPASGLYLSLILQPRLPPHVAPLLNLAAAVSMHDVVERVTGLDVDVKWPNDLLVGRRKVCGILSEMEAEIDVLRRIVIGVGVNINHTAMPEEIRDRATSLRMASRRGWSRIEILIDFLEDFERLYNEFAARGSGVVVDKWMACSSFAEGHKIRVDDGLRTIEGVSRGLTARGALMVERSGGTIEEVYSGDVIDWE